MSLEHLKFNSEGLIAVVVQDAVSGKVLMQAWANHEALSHTLTHKEGAYYSRSRKELWIKGKTSGHTQQVRDVRYDCDADSVLYLVEQTGAACHTGNISCFYNSMLAEETPPALGEVMAGVYSTIVERMTQQPENSYVTTMHRAGLDRILKKITEEAGEVLLASKNNNKAELASEVADLFFHTLFAMAEVGVNLADVAQVLSGRQGKSGLKPPKPVG